MKIPELTVLQQQMDRKDFLKYVGAGAMLLFGGNAVIHALTGMQRMSKTPTHSTSPATYGYGGSPYGG